MTRGMFAHTHFLIVPLSQMRLRGAGGVFKLTQKYNAIQCNTMQYHASLITAGGAYHCPVGSIRPFFILDANCVAN